jgi:hypothetical protein
MEYSMTEIQDMIGAKMYQLTVALMEIASRFENGDFQSAKNGLVGFAHTTKKLDELFDMAIVEWATLVS